MNLEPWRNQPQLKPTTIRLVGSMVGTRFNHVLTLECKCCKGWKHGRKFWEVWSLISWWSSTILKPTIIGLIGSLEGARTYQVLANVFMKLSRNQKQKTFFILGPQKWRDSHLVSQGITCGNLLWSCPRDLVKENKGKEQRKWVETHFEVKNTKLPKSGVLQLWRMIMVIWERIMSE